jgi:hypothetical protein
MSKQYSHSILRRVTITVTLTLLGLGAMSTAMQAAEGTARPGNESHLMLAATERMDRRQERREDRRENREDRRDVRQNCREEEGMFGSEKRDCKEEGSENSLEYNDDWDTDN